jgi:hypothetical protein
MDGSQRAARLNYARVLRIANKPPNDGSAHAGTIHQETPERLRFVTEWHSLGKPYDSRDHVPN